MFKRLTALIPALLLAATMLFSGTVKSEAQVRITVGVTQFDITVNVGSFNAINNAPTNVLISATNAPWFGSPTNATAFASAFISAATVADLGAAGSLAFTYAVRGSGNVDSAVVIVFGSSLVGATSTDTDPNATFIAPATLAYATAALVTGGSTVTVPEINGSALTQMMLVLGVGYMLLILRQPHQAGPEA